MDTEVPEDFLEIQSHSLIFFSFARDLLTFQLPAHSPVHPLTGCILFCTPLGQADAMHWAPGTESVKSYRTSVWRRPPVLCPSPHSVLLPQPVHFSLGTLAASSLLLLQQTPASGPLHWILDFFLWPFPLDSPFSTLVPLSLSCMEHTHRHACP